MELKYIQIHVQITSPGLLIVLNGIEMCELESKSAAKVLLIVLNGIEMWDSPFFCRLVLSFNRTKWN